MKKTGKGFSLAFFLALALSVRGTAQSPGFPVITRLSAGDTGFNQFIADVENNRRRLFNRRGGDESPRAFAETLTIYQYTPREGEGILDLAARCNIPYSAIASLNRLRHPALLETGKPLLLPSCPGLFIPEEPDSDLELLLASARLSAGDGGFAVLSIRRGSGSAAVRFYPGEDFSATERIFFLNTGFRFPLRSFRLTSAYGIRQNPVTGNFRLHQGLDLAAPEGSEVFAAGEGIVTETGKDRIYGNYVIIRHTESWTSLYGHLKTIETVLHSPVKSGTLIGRVGSTGQSTGPHLHFELRQNGKAWDPGKFLLEFRGN